VNLINEIVEAVKDFFFLKVKTPARVGRGLLLLELYKEGRV